MEERNEMEKIDDMMPGFRFHPTDEELVDFYLKRKIQQKSLPIELIKQVDIYKYDPWDLPKLASTGEKEWYFYCPRDRKYRNSARPNRVTRAGFWKATGTDRPIYSSEGKCIGLKKSLVFYRGRAAKGMKTDWMMHEFRLPSLSDSPPPKKLSDKSLPPTESWAICRIFKKTNSISMAQKALSHSWISQIPGSMVSEIVTQGANCHQFSSENISCTTESASPAIQFCNTTTNFSPSQFPVPNGDLPENFIFYTPESTKCTIDANSMFSNNDFMGFEEPNQPYSGFSISVPQDLQETEQEGWRKNHGSMQWENVGRIIGFPFNLPPPNDVAWNKANVAWDSSSCPSEMPTATFSTNKCYT